MLYLCMYFFYTYEYLCVHLDKYKVKLNNFALKSFKMFELQQIFQRDIILLYYYNDIILIAKFRCK